MLRYRHEWKREISLSARIALRARLEAVCRRAMSFCPGRMRQKVVDAPAKL